MSAEGAKAWYYANKDRAHLASRAWAEAHPERRKEISRKSALKRYYENLEKKREEARLRARTPEVRLRRAEQRRERLASDPVFKLVERYRTRVWRALKRGTQKANDTEGLLGCSFAALKVYLENQFLSGMTWENYGDGWHVDHKRPCASFNLVDPEQQKKCFHHTNLQPLWARDNILKGAKIV